MFRSLIEDADGLLWVNIGIARPDWKPTIAQDDRRERPPMTFADVQGSLQTMIEVIDPQGGTVVASIRLPGTYAAVGRSLFVFTVATGPDGEESVVLFRLTLVR
jgi:hypothetical protein